MAEPRIFTRFKRPARYWYDRWKEKELQNGLTLSVAKREEFSWANNSISHHQVKSNACYIKSQCDRISDTRAIQRQLVLRNQQLISSWCVVSLLQVSSRTPAAHLFSHGCSLPPSRSMRLRHQNIVAFCLFLARTESLQIFIFNSCRRSGWESWLSDWKYQSNINTQVRGTRLIVFPTDLWAQPRTALVSGENVHKLATWEPCNVSLPCARSSWYSRLSFAVLRTLPLSSQSAWIWIKDQTQLTITFVGLSLSHFFYLRLWTPLLMVSLIFLPLCTTFSLLFTECLSYTGR